MTDMTDVIDLRNADQGRVMTDSTTHVEGPEHPSGPGLEPHTGDATMRRRRRIIVLVLLALVALVIGDMIVGAAAHAEHQRHLAAEFVEPLTEPLVGDASFVLQAPAIGLNEVVVEGSSATELRGGPGRRLDSVVPSDPGNTVIEGTSVRFGGPFADLRDLKGGNSIYLRSRGQEVTAYKVTKVRVVGSGDVKYLAASGPSRLTLVSSSGRWPLDGHRVIVIATADDVVTEGEDSSAEPAAPPAVIADEQEEPTYDVRSLGGALLLLSGIGLVAVGVVGATGLRREYSLGSVVVVAGSSIALGVVLIFFNISAVLPTTY